ncbi:modification methylase [Candidatus Epulonipiscium fishelsonii]|uniref:Modification methylase n=1 Tax=Candidatus Epulonipiscium fishelsonii TaxID=77094 RepID=A0ACC8XJN3_9FIRM|nr:modification methylase [Epulopiscium sp. SCG-D08WGA-EpuloA1]OON95126.1 MAG: modification methylase [Epulopiscium sp. AS2M-Bin002]
MNYIGSKYSLLDFLTNTIDEVTNIKNGENLVFGDLFAGTGVVGVNFKKKGYTVIANDIQHYSYVLNNHYIENNETLSAFLLEHLNSLNPVEGFIYKNYCLGSGSERSYFTDYNGKKCDAIRIEIEKLYKSHEISQKMYYYYLASLINSIDKLANTASVYGAFLKHIKKSAQKKLKLELLPIIQGANKGKVYNKNINDLIPKIKGDILYLDPPYNSRQYSANYHLLETISKYDNPDIKGKTGLRDYNMQKSLYCSKKTVKATFEDLIKRAKFKYIFVSYNNEGLMSLEDIKEVMSKYGQYKVFTTEYRRFKADKEEKRNHKANVTTEYLHCLIK